MTWDAIYTTHFSLAFIPSNILYPIWPKFYPKLTNKKIGKDSSRTLICPVSLG
jgi:hypothetical protein